MFDCLERWEKDLNAKWINNVIEKFTYTSSLHFHSTTIFLRFYLYGSQHAFFSLNQMNINNIFFSFMHAQNPLSNWTTCVLFFSYSAKPKWLNVNSLILPVDEPNEKKIRSPFDWFGVQHALSGWDFFPVEEEVVEKFYKFNANCIKLFIFQN